MTPQQQAEQLARKCADQMGHALNVEKTLLPPDEWLVTFDAKKGATVILQHIPLQQLFEVASAAKAYHLAEPTDDLKQYLDLQIALETLRKQGIEV